MSPTSKATWLKPTARAFFDSGMEPSDSWPVDHVVAFPESDATDRVGEPTAREGRRASPEHASRRSLWPSTIFATIGFANSSSRGEQPDISLSIVEGQSDRRLACSGLARRP